MRPQKIIVSAHPDNDACVMVVPVDAIGEPQDVVVLGAGASHAVSFGEDHQMRVLACEGEPTVKPDPIKVPKDAVVSIARVCHEVNRAYCASLGDYSQVPWDDASNDIRGSAILGVKMHLNKPDATPKDSHDSWMANKEKEGWAWGPTKDAALKLHPCMVPYESLPAEQRAKDFIFRGTVHAIAREMVRP